MRANYQSPLRPEPQVVPRLVVSTDALPERDRLPFYREELARVLNLDITPLGGRPPRHALDYVDAGPIGFSRQRATPCHCSRTRRHLGDSDENFTLAILSRGWVATNQNGQAVRVASGEGFFLANALPVESTMPEGVAVTVLKIDGPSLHRLSANPSGQRGIGLLRRGPASLLSKVTCKPMPRPRTA